MNTVRELAAELNVTPDEVLIVLADIRELALGADSSVRDEAAAIVRDAIQNRSNSLPDSAQVDRVVDPLVQPSSISLSLQGVRTGRRLDKKQGMKRGEVTDKSLRFLLEQHAQFSGSRRRNLDFFNADELETARNLRAEWVKESLNRGIPLEDNEIHAWLVEFPDRILSPRSVLPLIAAGLKPRDVKLRLWYGRENAARPMIFERIAWGDLSPAEANEEIARFRSRPGAWA